MEPWFLNEILTGLQKLYTLSLDRTPAADVLPGTASTWVEALTMGRNWDQQRDTPRIREAFARMKLDAQRWPSPRDFLDALPTASTQPQLTHDRDIPASREMRTRRLSELLGDQFNPRTADPDYDPTQQHIDHMRLLYSPPSLDED